MVIRLQHLWQTMIGSGRRESPAARPDVTPRSERAAGPTIDIAPDDPLLAYAQTASGVVEVDKLDLASPALAALKAAGVKVIVPLVSQGELIGLLTLGPRRSDQEYSVEDRILLNTLALQAAPALRVAQLARQQQAEAIARERIEQEMRVARQIQLSLLPKEVPALPGWQLATYYQPARAVGGDFYDFLALPDGQCVITIGDVADKGVPAALVMATTRSILRGAARRQSEPAAVLERANDILCPEMPPNMFVTCLYAVLDPASGRLRFANAGHDLPYRRHADGVAELRATGLPLGLLPGTTYEEREVTLAPGDTVLFYSDGLVEAHDPRRAMFGFPRLKALVAAHPGGAALLDTLRSDLRGFTGPEWEQEDDVTLITLRRATTPAEEDWTTLAAFSIASEAGNEHEAMHRVIEAVGPLGLAPARVERLKTAVAEATMNAIEHGNHFQPDRPVSIRVLVSATQLAVDITDQGGGQPIPDVAEPDLDAKLAGSQSSRGWGLFLIKNMVDELRISSNATHHTVTLILNRDEDA